MKRCSQSCRQRIVVAGQTPPPIGGQNICIQRILDLLSKIPDYRIDHLSFEFTKSWQSARRFGMGKVFELLKVICRLIGLRFSGKIDVLIYPAGGPHFFAIFRDAVLLPWIWLCSNRVALHFHAAGLAEYVDSNSRFTAFVVRSIYGLFCSEAIVLSSFGHKDATAAGISKIHLLPNAVLDHATNPLVRKSTDSCEILSVGHLCRDKGTPQLLEAFSNIAEIFPNVRLRLVGEPLSPYSKEELLSDIQKSNCKERIQWTGVLEGNSLQEAFRNANLFVFSSIAPYESFGLVMVEAMQWSLPLVITDWRANHEVCTKDFGGIVAKNPENDLAKSLVSAITDALENRKNWPDWGITNRRIYESHYTAMSFKQRLLDIITPPFSNPSSP